MPTALILRERGHTQVGLHRRHDLLPRQLPDATESFVRSPWQKQEDGSWKKLSDPNDKGGDNNVYYEDKMAMIWDINDSIEDFPPLACATVCHLDKEQAVKPDGNEFTAGEGQMGDHLALGVSARHEPGSNDQYLDSTQ